MLIHSRAKINLSLYITSPAIMRLRYLESWDKDSVTKTYIDHLHKTYTCQLDSQLDTIHELDSIAMSVDLFDTIKMHKRQDKKINVKFNNMSIADRQNTVKKVLEWAINKYNICGYDIMIKKGIPTMAGLGGSSSNIGSILYVLQRLYNLEYDYREIVQFGSDIPYMINGGGARIQGIGEIVRQFDCNKEYNIAILMNGKVSTKECFNNFDNNYSNGMKIADLPGVDELKRTAEIDHPQVIKVLQQGIDEYRKKAKLKTEPRIYFDLPMGLVKSDNDENLLIKYNFDDPANTEYFEQSELRKQKIIQRQKELGILEHLCSNSLIYSAKRLNKSIDDNIKNLYDCGAIYANMSGSGAACFGIFSDNIDMHSILEKIKKNAEFCCITKTKSLGTDILDGHI